MHAWLGFAIFALIFWGITGITQKLSTNRISSERSFLWFCYAMVALSAVVLLFAHPHWGLATIVVVSRHRRRRTSTASAHGPAFAPSNPAAKPPSSSL